MSNHEKALYIREKFNVDYYHALSILKANDYDLMLSCGYFRDMETGANNAN